MTELNHSLKACEMTEDDFVYLAEDVDALLEEKENQILSLKKEIKGLHVALSLP
jgi:ribosomal protein L7Ae-like RNA K-turn-binding protein